ncbi:hypothetical protein CRG98_012835 [Punica granatum]|uniref:Uncharacterized protein n=1 Tax=Punica granatum TaxID=22663 RepID=A0A2I0KE94_PUNGR|nr:hypothetical protein CRG98_012835 [Punica granatum]
MLDELGRTVMGRDPVGVDWAGLGRTGLLDRTGCCSGLGRCLMAAAGLLDPLLATGWASGLLDPAEPLDREEKKESGDRVCGGGESGRERPDWLLERVEGGSRGAIIRGAEGPGLRERIREIESFGAGSRVLRRAEGVPV